MLQADLPALVQKRLEILIRLVLVVLAAQDGLDEQGIGRGRGPSCGRRRFEVLNILEAAQAAGDVACGQRVALERGDHAHHVHHVATFRGARLNARHIERQFAQAEGDGSEPVSLHAAAKLLRHRHAVNLKLGDHQESDGMNGRKGSGRQHRPLHAFLAFHVFGTRAFHKRVQIGEVAKSFRVHG